ncbi:MAG: plasmid pRiA4b ORF-3 family protein [Bacteroidia bacterium]|nr:plasmid pRiA4b ORF-3 family protein [Bacteroidia bacterium]
MVYQIKVTLDYSKPPIWRRLLVQPKISFMDLHYIIQGAMGWENAHLFMFYDKSGYNGLKIGVPYDDDFYEEDIVEADKMLVNELLKVPKDSCIYEYDFGDGWRHIIVLEKILEDIILPKAICIKGTGACPPEDCGGMGGYYGMVAALNNPKDPESENYREWLGLEEYEKWDPAAFELDEANSGIQMYLSDSNY